MKPLDAAKAHAPAAENDLLSNTSSLVRILSSVAGSIYEARPVFTYISQAVYKVRSRLQFALSKM
jgi:hypothetical protein